VKPGEEPPDRQLNREDGQIEEQPLEDDLHWTSQFVEVFLR
jgi:hypothetical protein